MRRALITVIILLVVVIVVPPILASLFGWNDFSADRPEPGKRVALSSEGHLNVIDSGHGAPVVLVHGSPGSAYDWRPLPEHLEARGCRVIRYDRVGYGFSSRQDDLDQYTLEANARDLLSLLEALDLERATLVGWSYGGGVVQLTATLEADRVRALALVGSIGPSYEPSDEGLVERILFSKPVARWSFAVGLPARANTARISKLAFSPDEPPPWWTDQSVALMARPGSFEALRAEDARMNGGVLESGHIGISTTVFHGTDDAFVPLAVAEDLDQRLPESELVAVSQAGHMLPVTHPELLSKKIGQLAGCSAAAGDQWPHGERSSGRP